MLCIGVYQPVTTSAYAQNDKAQPIKGGMQHWLFEKEILDDLLS